MEEKRRFKRFGYELKMTIDTFYKQDHPELQDIEAEISVHDISRNGLGFESKSLLPIDFYFKANIIFSQEKHFFTVLKIIRREETAIGYFYGCEFVGLAETLATVIEEYNNQFSI